MITTYQIRSVLRIYGDQLKKKSALLQGELEPPRQTADLVNISIEARRKQRLSQMSDHLISSVTQKAT